MVGIRLVIALAASVAATGTGWAQGFPQTQYDGAMNHMLRQNQALTQQMLGAQQQLTQDAMNDPQVQAGYNAYRWQGGTQDFATWAYNYRATNGYSVQGMQQYRQNEAINNFNERMAYQRYQQAQEQRAQAMQNQQNSFYNNQYQSGMQLGGWQYTRPYDGTTWWYRP